MQGENFEKIFVFRYWFLSFVGIKNIVFCEYCTSLFTGFLRLTIVLCLWDFWLISILYWLYTLMKTVNTFYAIFHSSRISFGDIFLQVVGGFPLFSCFIHHCIINPYLTTFYVYFTLCFGFVLIFIVICRFSSFSNWKYLTTNII